MMRLLAPFVLVVCLSAAADVISVVKPNRSGGLGAQLGVPFAGRFTATNVTAAGLIAAAYGGLLPLDASRIEGLPAWASQQRFDIEVRAEDAEPTEDSEDDAAIAAAFAIVRTMLADRFALRVHDASRLGPVFVLERTGRASAALKRTTRDCDDFAKLGPFVEGPRGPDGLPLGPCGVRVRAGELAGSGATLATLASRLSTVPGVGRDVIDRTGLEGRYDFLLRWAPPQPAQADRDGTAAVSDSGPSLFTALREQLGLRLRSDRAPLRVLVIDHIDRPTPN
jgi:bla regulator protein blaR1